MKACVNTRYGPPEVVSVIEVEQPVPKDNEVLIKVIATTVNRTDCGFRSAEYVVSRFFSGLLKPSNSILGNEFAGIIEATGKSVTSLKAGNRVFGYNDSRFGAHAGYMTLAETDMIALMPTNVTFEEAAPITEGAHYALCNIRAAKVTAGQQVMVYGATGAIGSAAVQLLKYFGARVTAVCATPQVDLVKSLGADNVIDYTREDYTQTNLQFHLVLDAVGKSSFGKCKPLLHKKGIYISTELGKHGENIWLALTTPLLGSKKVMFPIPSIKKDDLLLLQQLVETGHYKPVIDRQYNLQDIVAAYHYVESGQKIGNVVINVS